MVVIDEADKYISNTPRKDMNPLIKSLLDGIVINKKLKVLEKQTNPYVVNKKPDYSGTVHPDNEGIIRWTKPFLRSLE